ncbi:MAG TPA: PHP domain-containing protein [Clostridiales bacterium]|nr:PHP domain-containing protein [Clostridiales bacterium]
MKIDTHCHTKEGSPDGLVNIKDTINGLIKKGYDGMIVTDHNSYEGYNSIKYLNYKNFTIFKGIEYDTSDAGHMLIILPTEEDNDIFTHKGMKMKDVIKIVKGLGGILGPAHPFDYYKLGILNNARWIKNQNIIKEFSFIETFNSCGSELGNQKANLIAKIYNKPGLGGSDSHRTGSVGQGYTILPHKIENQNELINLIKCLDYKDTQVGGILFKGSSKDKLGMIYSVGIRAFYLISLVTSVFSRKKAIKIALALSLI